MLKSKKLHKVIYLLVASFLTIYSSSLAQCAMCKASAETNSDSGNTQAAGINTAVLYVLVICFTIIAAGTYTVWKLRNTDELNA